MAENKFSSVVDGVVVVDWSKAPEGATHYTPDCETNYEGWCKVVKGKVRTLIPTMYGGKWFIDDYAKPEDLEKYDFIKK